MRVNLRKLVAFSIVAAAVFVVAQQRDAIDGLSVSGVALPAAPAGSAVANAFAERRRSHQLEDGGIVARVLPDDNQGSRHQRFVVRFPDGHTVLVAHNIDLAPRIPGLRQGDSVRFFGEYEWNDKGGVVHWTHHDPDGSHIAGWLEHEGQRYQ